MWIEVYEVPLPPGHRFPMLKYRMVRRKLQQILLPGELAVFEVSPLATMDELETVHSPAYVQRYLSGNFSPAENRRVGFPWSHASVDRSLSSAGGTVAAMRAIADGRCKVAAHIAGGTHHAFMDRGEGFCVFSDIAVAAGVALRDYTYGLGRQILVIDLDVHQGNGNAAIFQNEPRVFTFSVQCSANYFSKVEQSDLDLELPEGAGDDDYLAVLQRWLPSLFRKVEPSLVFFQGGVDPLKTDRLGRMNLTRKGLKRRNQFVYDMCLTRGVPMIITMGGGYPKDLNPNSESFAEVVGAHVDVYVQAAQAHSNHFPASA